MHTRRLFNAAAAASPFGIFAGDLPGTYFSPDPPPAADPPATTPPATPPAAAPPATTPPAAAPPADDWKAKFEAADAERKRLADAEQARKDAELSEIEREKKRADDAAAEAAKNKQELLKLRIANELGVSADAIDLLTGGDEATLRAQAAKIVALGGKSAGGQQQQPPVNAGTRTQPGAQQQPTVDDQIAAAVKGGNDIAAIRLMRQKQGITQ